MSLQVGLPLNKDLRQKGLSDVTIINNGATHDMSVGSPMGGSYNLTSGPIEISNLPNPSNISIAFWFKRTANTGTRQFMFTAGNGVTCELTTAGNPTWAVYRASYPTVTGGTAITTSSGWVHYCGTFSVAEGLKLYINGDLVGSNTTTTPIAGNTTTGQIGKYSSYASMSALISDFRIYSRALTANEVRELSRGLAVHYPLARQGFPSENLFQATAFNTEEIGTLLGNNASGWENRPCGFYNGAASNHNIADGIDTITVNSASNIGIAFCRKASDIALDPNSYYTISCEAQSTQTAKPLCIGLSYNNGNATNPWIGRGGTNPQNFTAVNKGQKFTLTFKPDADTQYIDYCFTVSGESGSSFTYKLRHCKLEKGSTATDGIPNSSDLLGQKMGLNSNSIEDISGFNWHGVKSDLLQGTGDTHIYPVCADFTSGQSCTILNPPDYQGNANLTLAAWVYPKARNSDRDCILIYRGQYLTIDSAGHLSGYAYGKSSAGYHTGTGVIPLNQGSHIAITGDASNIKLYINGSLDKSVACTGTFSGVVKVNGCIGLEIHPNLENPTEISRQFIGSIADVRVYATALSAADITKLYNNTIYLNNMHNIA